MLRMQVNWRGGGGGWGKAAEGLQKARLGVAMQFEKALSHKMREGGEPEKQHAQDVYSEEMSSKTEIDSVGTF